MSKLKVFALVAIAIISFSCKKGAPPAQPLTDLLNSGGSWTITEFPNYLDTLANYTGYSLVFFTDGKLQVNRNTLAGNGTWRTYNSGEVLYLSIDVGQNDFSYLESEWSVVRMNPTLLELSPGFLAISYMTLQKN